MSGLPLATISGYQAERRSIVTAPTWRRVMAAWDALSGSMGRSVRTIKRAAAAGWSPPMAWDDIDDPAEQPNLGTYEAGLGEDFDEAVRTLTRDGWSAARIAEQLGVSERSVVRARTRARGAA